jgi:NAD(P)-dependent dehydrogenase (short-subunit alcohol dehydrogenase family)
MTRTGLPYRLPYAVSKVAFMGLTETVAPELGPDSIRINTILPGAINNQRVSDVIRDKAAALGVAPADYEAELLSFISLRTVVEPVEIAHMAVYLASPSRNHILG